MRNGARMLAQQVARFGRQGAAAIARQQVLPQPDLQQPVQGRLHNNQRNTQRNGGPSEAAELCHAYKIRQLFQVPAKTLCALWRKAGKDLQVCFN